MCVGFACNFRRLNHCQVLHVAMENFSEITNKISSLPPDRVLHEVPGKLTQR
jgi:hypothetical protein